MSPQQALNRVAALCSQKEYCLKDIRIKLEKWEIQEIQVNEILAFLVKNNFINEERFAKAYANDKFRFKKWGKQKITVNLRQKEISRELISIALNELEQENYDHLCLQLLEQKAKKIKNSSVQQDKAKLIRFALSRGFEYDTILKCLSKIRFEDTSEKDF